MHSPKVSTQRWCCSPAHTSLLFMALAVLCMQSHVSARSPVMLADDSKSYSVQCGQCDESRCPVLSYCEGQAIKDSCNCCTVCSSPKYQPHVSVVGGELGLAAPPPSGSGDALKHECGKVKCPKFQVCVANMQGLPLCKCPSEFLCRSNRKRAICGTDGITYESKCHMRIASCKQGMMVRKKHRRACTAADEREGETFKRKMRRRMRRRRRRRQKLEEGTEAEDTVDESTVGGGEIVDGGMGDGEEGLTNFRRDSDVFGNEKRRGKLALQPDETGPQKGKGDKRKEKRAKLKRRRRRKKNRKQRKQRKGSKRDKNERRRRRRKRQNGKPRSRSKRHRYSKKSFDDDAEARERMFEEEFGQSTWYS